MSISAGAIVPESRERLRFGEIAKFVEDFEQKSKLEVQPTFL